MIGLNTDSQPYKFIRSQRGDNRPQPVMAACRASFPNADRAEWQRQVITNNDQLPTLWSRRMLCNQTSDRLTTQVHVGLRLREFDGNALNLRSADECPAFATTYNALNLIR